jgi:hypothetical protein
MLYDAERTRDVVHRLVLLGNRLQVVTIVINAIQYGALLGILGLLAAGPLGLILALVGVIAGVYIGIFISGALSTVLEWMAQMLISQQPKQQ